MVGLLQAIPGTELHQRLNIEGPLIGHTTSNNLDGTTNFIPRMNRETLRKGYKSLMGYLYAPGPYYQRIPSATGRFNRRIQNGTPRTFFLPPRQCDFRV